MAVEGPDRAVYVLDREGSRVVRYVRGRSMQVAGGTEPGSGAGELNAGPTGRIYVPQFSCWGELLGDVYIHAIE